MSTRSRLRSQDGFIREVVWIVVILAVIAVVILDGMAIFNAYQSAGNTSSDAAQAALTEYAQSQNASAAKLAAEEQLAKNGLTMVGFKITQTAGGDHQGDGDGQGPRRHLRLPLPRRHPAAQGLGGAHHEPGALRLGRSSSGGRGAPGAALSAPS